MSQAVDSPTWEYVLDFATEMERKLALHRDRGNRAGWLIETPRWLFERMLREVVELGNALGYPVTISVGRAEADGEEPGQECATIRQLRADLEATRGENASNRLGIAAYRGENTALRARISELEREGSKSEMSELIRGVQHWQDRALDHAKAHDDALADLAQARARISELERVSVAAAAARRSVDHDDDGDQTWKFADLWDALDAATATKVADAPSSAPQPRQIASPVTDALSAIPASDTAEPRPVVS